MKCVRCLRDTASKAAEAPDGSKAWTVYCCSTCNYSWNTNEPDFITDVSKRDPWAQLDKIKDFEKEIMTIPPYKTIKVNPETGK